MEVVRGVMAAGFPNYKYASDKPPYRRRSPAQPFGSVTTVEDYSDGYLTLKLEGGEPAAPTVDAQSPWAGLSGAGVVVNETLIGIVIEHHRAEGLGSIRFVPFTKIGMLSLPDQMAFCAILGVEDPTSLPSIDTKSRTVDSDLAVVKDLREIAQIQALGYLTKEEARELKVHAYKRAKGWLEQT